MEKKEQGALLGFFLFFGGLYWAGDSWKSAEYLSDLVQKPTFVPMRAVSRHLRASRA